jgi:hypothetical protein
MLVAPPESRSESSRNSVPAPGIVLAYRMDSFVSPSPLGWFVDPPKCPAASYRQRSGASVLVSRDRVIWAEYARR